MPKRFQIIFLVIFLAIFAFLLSQEAHASCADVPLSGDYTVAASCSFAGTVDGIENGNLTIAEEKTLTITTGQTVIFNPGKSVYIYGSMAMTKTPVGGQMRKSFLWYIDEDNDGLADSMTQYAASSAAEAESMAGAPGGSAKSRSHSDFTTYYDNDMDLMAYGWVDEDGDDYPERAVNGLGLVLNSSSTAYYVSTTTNPTSQDCNDASSTIWVNKYTDSDDDGYCPDNSTTCVGSHSGYISSCTSYTDCDDASSTIWVDKYTDSDEDGHCPNSSQTCVGNHSGYRTSCTRYDDCCDTDSDTYYGQTSYFTSTDNCSSWDYNCNGQADRSPTTYRANCVLSNWYAGYRSDCSTDNSGYTSCSDNTYDTTCGADYEPDYCTYPAWSTIYVIIPYDCVDSGNRRRQCTTDFGTAACR